MKRLTDILNKTANVITSTGKKRGRKSKKKQAELDITPEVVALSTKPPKNNKKEKPNKKAKGKPKKRGNKDVIYFEIEGKEFIVSNIIADKITLATK